MVDSCPAPGAPTTKVCRRCLRPLPIERFRGRSEARDGLQSYCRECQRTWLRERPGRKAAYRRHERARERAGDASALAAARQSGPAPDREARDRQHPDPRTPRAALERRRWTPRTVALILDWDGPFDERYFEALAALELHDAPSLIAGPPPVSAEAGGARSTRAGCTRPSGGRARGRPPGTGTYPIAEALRADAGPALQRLRRDHQRVTQLALARALHVDVSTLTRTLKRLGLTWAEIRRWR